MDDGDAYLAYPQHHKWFNKLYLAECMGYVCGPAGVGIPHDGTYVVRPIYNLSGMGVGAEVKQLKKFDQSTPAGYFWCEYIEGEQYSATYEFIHDTQPYWKPISCWTGVNTSSNLIQFIEWKRSDYIPQVPRILNQLSDVKIINVEFIGDKPIDVHLRESPDPDYDHIIPVWASGLNSKIDHASLLDYQFVASYDDADGQLKDPRIGFLVK